MQIRIKETGMVMLENEFRNLFPNSSLPQQLTEESINALGGDIVFEGPQAPGGTVYQYSQYAGVEQVDGKWFTKYILGPVFTNAEEEAAYKLQKDAEQATRIRLQRDAKLQETDWRFRVDMNPSQAWRDYCQALRDVPNQTGFPWTINWPESP